jgi:hypothetical protein
MPRGLFGRGVTRRLDLQVDKIGGKLGILQHPPALAPGRRAFQFIGK